MSDDSMDFCTRRKAIILSFALLASLATAQEPKPVDWKLGSANFAGESVAVEVVGKPEVISENGLTFTQFDGKKDGYVIANNPIQGWPQFTIELHLRADVDGEPAPRFLNIDDTSRGRITMEFRLTKDGQWSLDEFLLQKPTRFQSLDLTKLHSAGVWHWVAMSYDGKTMTSYIDGVREHEGPATMRPMQGGKMSLGVRLTDTFWFKGGIAEFKATPRALLPDELSR